jgi:Uma2 family endonuclease
MLSSQPQTLNKNSMNTKKEPKPKKLNYKFKEEKPTIVEEPFIKYPALHLDETKRYTYADYLLWIDEKRRELFDGFIHLMSAPSTLHARITYLIGLFMGVFVRTNNGKCQIFHAPFDVRLPRNNETADDKIFDVVQPDICVICDLTKIDARGCIGAPDLIVEVLSPSTSKKDWTKKFNLYETHGVREYWIVDPNARAVHIFLLQPDGKYDEGTIYECDQIAPVHIFEGLEIDLKELFRDEIMR